MKKLRFEEFTKAVVEKIKDFLPESFANAAVELQTVTKNNDLKLTGLTIRSTGNICPTIYLEQFFEMYNDGHDMKEILEKIAELRVCNDMPGFDVGEITEFSRVCDKIVPRLVGEKWNKDLLENRPHKTIADLAVTYAVVLSDNADGTASAPITYDLLRTWGVSIDTLHDAAIRNLPKLCPSFFVPMSSMLASLMGGEDLGDMGLIAPEDEAMYILSNKTKMYGAANLLDVEIMDKIVDKFGTDFYILPSSIHEVIIVSSNTRDLDVETLTAMVRDVNEGQVAPQDRLSDRVYRYTKDDGIVFA